MMMFLVKSNPRFVHSLLFVTLLSLSLLITVTKSEKKKVTTQEQIDEDADKVASVKGKTKSVQIEHCTIPSTKLQVVPGVSVLHQQYTIYKL